MRTASPWWASLAFGVGLLLTFVSERLVAHQAGLRVALTGLGIGVLIAIAGARVWTTLGSTGARRRVERTLLMCHAGTLLALVVYALTTKWGMGVIGSESARVSGALSVIWTILMLASVVPVLMIELSLGVALRTNFDVDNDGEDAGVEYFRVRDVGWSGLTIALAVALLMVTCNVAKERNISRDVSYFKTSSPGQSTKNIVAATKDVIRVHLFFPDPNEVKEQVHDYFQALASATGNLQIEINDRATDPKLAEKYKVKKEGVIVLARGKDESEKFFTIELDTDLAKARRSTGKLRNLDREVNSELIKLVRDQRKIYFTKGHGEVNDLQSVPPELQGRILPRSITILRQLLGDLHYEIKELTPMDLARDVPDDATIVMVLAPSVPMQPAEWDALDRYVARGGKLMVALDPKGAIEMGSLETRLGTRMMPGYLTDAVAFMPQGTGSPSERRVVMTTQLTAHATTTSASRDQLFLIEAGALEEAPFPATGAKPKRTVTIRSMDSSWVDYNENFEYDTAGAKPEKKQRYDFGVVLEGPKLGDKDGYRAIVYADVDLFADIVARTRMGVRKMMPGGRLLIDSVRWLGGEEVFAGEIVSEDDKPIKHTKNEDAVWFTLTTVGAPLLVLTLGLVGTWARRRRAKKSEVTL